jgi:signal transduction histidine kinase
VRRDPGRPLSGGGDGVLQQRPRRFVVGTLRQRVVSSFVILVGLSLLGVGTYIYFETEHRLLQEVDIDLSAAASQALVSLQEEDGRLVLRGDAATPTFHPGDAEFALRVLSTDGIQWDGTGQVMTGLPWPPSEGYMTVKASDDNWRVLSEAIPQVGASPAGWIEVARSLATTEDLLGTLRTQLYLVLPIALVLAAIAGYLFTGRTLRPVVRISQVADSIGPGDLGRRIRYQGPDDEVGRMAAAFDRMLDRVEQAFARERRFTSDASHELRTPLTAIKGGIGVTLSRPRTPAEYASALEDLDRQVDRLIRLSTGLLTIARAGRPRSETPEIVDLSDLLRVVAEQVEPLTQQKGLDLQIDIQAGLRVEGFAEDLARVFLNILANAVAFTSSSGRIRLTAESGATSRTGWVCVEVADNGAGIATADLPHIFEPFYRGSVPRSEEDGGSGLGLAIAREIVLAHGGSLEATSREGEGSTFRVRLPAAR